MKWHFDDFIYGSIDGAVTTFAIVAGVVGASLSPSIILILGFANLFADGFSMAAANYQASKARNEFVQMKRRQEEWEIDNLEEQRIIFHNNFNLLNYKLLIYVLNSIPAF